MKKWMQKVKSNSSWILLFWREQDSPSSHGLTHKRGHGFLGNLTKNGFKIAIKTIRELTLKISPRKLSFSSWFLSIEVLICILILLLSTLRSSIRISILSQLRKFKNIQWFEYECKSLSSHSENISMQRFLSREEKMIKWIQW